MPAHKGQSLLSTRRHVRELVREFGKSICRPLTAYRQDVVTFVIQTRAARLERVRAPPAYGRSCASPCAYLHASPFAQPLALYGYLSNGEIIARLNLATGGEDKGADQGKDSDGGNGNGKGVVVTHGLWILEVNRKGPTKCRL